MSGLNLDASNFVFADEIYSNEFKNILKKIVYCYCLLMKSDANIPLNDENGIRDILVNDFINNSKIKEEIQLEYFVLPEVNETLTHGRTDIRIFSPNSYYQQEAYFILECKRLDSKARKGISGLNYKYIDQGIKRFTTDYYSSYYRTNGLLGFVIEDIDIDRNIQDVNFLLENYFESIQTKRNIKRESFIENFQYHYSSLHTTENGNQIELYHLMFDLYNKFQ